MSKQPKPFIKGYKYRIYPTDEQKQYFAQAFGNCRFVWNQLLAKSIKDYEAFVATHDSDLRRQFLPQFPPLRRNR